MIKDSTVTGFSLLEVLLALLVLSSGVLMLTALQISLLARVEGSAVKTQAIILASNNSELLLSRGNALESFALIAQDHGHRVDAHQAMPASVGPHAAVH